MEEDKNKKQERERDFISYINDSGEQRNQKIFIVEKDISGVTFKMNWDDTNTTFIPMHRILKIKISGDIE